MGPLGLGGGGAPGGRFGVPVVTLRGGGVAQINMLLQYKGGADEEECPVPQHIRDQLLQFHSDLLAHCGERNRDPRRGGAWGPPGWGGGDVGTPRVGV